MEIIEELNYLGRIYHTGFGFMKEENTNIVVNYGYNFEDEDHDDELIEYDNLINRANKVVQYKKVILKFDLDYKWYNIPSTDWYNNPSKWFTGDKFKKSLLPYLSSRKYIEVVDRFIEIHINSDIKENLITLDDIMFATRGLALDDTRSVCNYDNKYKILSSDKNILVLAVGIDNFST
jgi:hypothetical protein